MPKLFEITEDALALADLIEELDGDITGQEEAVQAFLNENDAALADKVENYCKVIKTKEVAASARKAEAKRIADLAKSDEGRVKWLKQQLHDAMQLLDMPKIETATHKVSVVKNGGQLAVIIDDADAVMQSYGSLVMTMDAEAKTNLRADLMDGAEVKGARFGVRGTSLRIK